MTPIKSLMILPSAFRLLVLLALLAAALLVPCGGSLLAVAQEEPADHPFARKFKAPSLDGGVEWINTAGPIDLKELRGKFVLLDFWTYCCINCMHILPELKKLEQAYPNEVVVIGVHSAKFDNERDSKNIREAVERYEIDHPVINDAGHVIWNKYEVQSWPTLCVIDPEGNLVARNSGEVDFETLDGFLKRVLPFYRANGLIKPSPPPLTGENAGMQAPDTALRYPGKVLADEKSDRLFIADSTHNRIVVTRLDGTLLDVIGSGQVGAADGDYATAAFDHPQGMALDDKDDLYVADTENHLIRKVDLKKKHVSTIAGTGKQARPAMAEFVAGAGAGKLVARPLKSPLNSPWALWLRGRELYIAMAGPHQIWRMGLVRNEIGPFAGNGREDIVDGPHLPATPYALGASSFAQPSGLASDGKVLFVADSEGSSIRAVPFDTSLPVTTLVGSSWSPMGRLFLYGDVDGQGQQVRLQHALGVLYHDNLLYVADTYNNKIKVVDPRVGTSVTLVGTGKPGKADSPAEFDEPAGLAYAAGKIYVADTNNHAVRTIDLKNKNQVATLNIPGLTRPPAPAVDTSPSFPDAVQVELPAVTLKPTDGKIKLQVELTLPEGYKINPLAPLRYLVQAAGESGPIDRQLIGALQRVETPATTFDIDLPVGGDGSEKLDVTVAYYYCQEGSEGLCKAGSVVWTLPVDVSAAGAESAAKLALTVSK